MQRSTIPSILPFAAISRFVVLIVSPFTKPPAVVVGAPIVLVETAIAGVRIVMSKCLASLLFSAAVIVPLVVQLFTISSHWFPSLQGKLVGTISLGNRTRLAKR